MKIGELIRLIPEMEGEVDYKYLWENPPDSTTIHMKNHTGMFSYTDTGIVLEQKHILDGPLHIQTTWIKVLCSGGIGWLKRYDVESVS